jgi:hypothetical protein
MQNFERRIFILEQNLLPTEKITIIRRIVWVGQQEAEIKQLRDENGTNWLRKLEESEHDFTERVKVEAFRNQWGVMLLDGFVWGGRVDLTENFDSKGY